jgi:ABC-2 type transport system permease protein
MVDVRGGPEVNVGRLTLRQTYYTNKAFWRNPASAFFTFAFPLMFLVIFTAILGNGHVKIGGKTINQSTYYVAGMAAFSVVTACFTNIAMAVSFQRDSGVLKRVRGTPLPAAAYLTARVIHAVFVAVILVAICAAFGAAFYDASIPGGATLLKFVVVLLVGGASFAALGLAETAVVPNADAAPPVVNATVFPLLFVSGIFFPVGDDAPKWIRLVGGFFPVKHFADGMLTGFIGLPFKWSDVLIVAAWGVGGLLVAVRSFSWEPRI